MGSLYIRTDMNPVIATGHMMRCLAIADELKRLGNQVTFFVSDSQAENLLKERGHAYCVLGTRWDDKDSEIPVIQALISEKHVKCLLIDSYQVTAAYLRAVRERTKTVYIDDRNTFRYPVDGLICYASYWKKFKYENWYERKQLRLGYEYVPLRKAFQNCPPKRIKRTVETILLMSGGSDPYHVLDQILERIHREQYRKVMVICGVYHPDYDDLCKKYGHEGNVQIRKSVSDIENDMAEADVAIAAGGTTLYELCAIGTPSISYAMADNQLYNVEQFQEDGLIDYAGDIRWDGVAENVAVYLQKYHTDLRLRERRSRMMQALIDGRGALRIAEYLEMMSE